MQNKKLLLVIIIIILFAGGYFLFLAPKDVKAPPIEEITPAQNAPSAVVETSTTTARIPKKYEVIYTADGFAPAVMNVEIGDTVVFKNKSGESFWPASNEHPTHASYPEFDAKTEITDMKIYEFVFTKSGAWGYHNHLSPKMMGVVVVKSL
jgi:plastocyanin